ncbi:MAG: DUF1549 domain-containing protein, partial [Planctomycetota bacterium]|nr:DUF1549 domain-containing protein [Planctomycetota bacterium]
MRVGLASFFIVATMLGCVELADARGAQDPVERQRIGKEQFEREVRAILERNCLECHHGPTAKGGLDLGTQESLHTSGMLGDSSADSHFLAVTMHSAEPHMPWKRERLDAASIEKIAQWIDNGAPYDRPLVSADAVQGDKRTINASDRQFWSYRPLSPGTVPAPQGGSRALTTVDLFLEAKLAEVGVSFGPLAERRILARRIFLDLLGVPPTPEQLAEYTQDKSPDAFERLVDRLLADPRYGERWARHWLDVARFAESDGFEHDTDRAHAFHYRDFVIRSLNSDQPYADFVRWQIAGDEFAPGHPLALAATGFLVAGVFPTQITESEFERTRYDQLDDMVATCGVAFLGMTIGCARCHDHKFDPITSEDYYRFAANFTATVPALTEADWDRVGPSRLPGTAEENAKIRIASEGLPPVVSSASSRGYPYFYS